MQEMRVWAQGQKDPLEKEVAAHSNTLGESHGQRSLVDYSAQGRKESDTTERLSQTDSLISDV